MYSAPTPNTFADRTEPYDADQEGEVSLLMSNERRCYWLDTASDKKGAAVAPLVVWVLLSIYGTSMSSIFPSLRRCSTLALPLGSRNTKTSRSRNSHSFTASSMVMGRIATESVA